MVYVAVCVAVYVAEYVALCVAVCVAVLNITQCCCSVVAALLQLCCGVGYHVMLWTSLYHCVSFKRRVRDPLIYDS